MDHVFVVGRFPPPLDGQTIATRRLAELIEPAYHVHRLNTSAPDSERVSAEVRFRPARVVYYAGMLRRTAATLRARPSAPVLWTSASPVALGHWRDVLTVQPTFAPTQPVFAVLHRAGYETLFRSPLTAPSARALVRRLNGVVFLSDQLSERCAEFIPDAKRIVIPNTVEQEVECTPEEVSRKQQGRHGRTTLRLLFLSNMIPEKGYRDVLGAVRLLHQAGVGVSAAFAGRWMSAGDQAEFEAEVTAAGLSEVVTHHGPVRSRAHIKQLHLQSDLFLLPSYYAVEAQPISIIEALSAGTPVLVTRHSGIPEMVRQGKEALFVAPHDPAGIAEAVRTMLNEELWLEMSQAARARFEARFSPDSVRTSWLELLAQAVRR